MVKDVLYGGGALLLGGASLVSWWFAMFSDSGYGGMCRSVMRRAFSLGRNTAALIQPGIGGFLAFGGGLSLVQVAGFQYDAPLTVFFGVVAGLSMVVALVGVIPFRLPWFMYPEGQMERRRRRRGMTDADAAEEVWRRAGSPSKDAGDPPGDDLPARSHRAEECEGE
ncbi:hypothetical protein [Actinomyces israelii]|uniref:hypothetical protein n=1 Tax=Actinomyces israelii TaxID=1659 RepID=UPI0025532467|nr:hypothetical protein [Actinomyces israelii]